MATEIPEEGVFGSKHLDPLRLNRDVQTIVGEVVQHLTKLKDANVDIVMDIKARIPDGAPEDVAQIVLESCRALRFDNQDSDWGTQRGALFGYLSRSRSRKCRSIDLRNPSAASQ